MFSQNCSFSSSLLSITLSHMSTASNYQKKKKKEDEEEKNSSCFHFPVLPVFYHDGLTFPNTISLGPLDQELRISLIILCMIRYVCYLLLKAFHQVDSSTFSNSLLLFTLSCLYWILKDAALILASALPRPPSLLLFICPLSRLWSNGTDSMKPSMTTAASICFTPMSFGKNLKPIY